jgi:phage regulator Rha-like protein
MVKTNNFVTNNLPIPIEFVERRIYLIRGQKVMLDSDLAELYQVQTKVLNQAVRRNLDRFPNDFMFQLSKEESANLRSQFVISSWNIKSEQLRNRSQFVTGSQKHRDPRSLPYAFTEHGVAMLSSVLRSERAVQMNILIIRAFIQMREILSSQKDIAEKFRQLEKQQKRQGIKIELIYKIIEHLVQKPAADDRKPIGFRTG